VRSLESKNIAIISSGASGFLTPKTSKQNGSSEQKLTIFLKKSQLFWEFPYIRFSNFKYVEHRKLFHSKYSNCCPICHTFDSASKEGRRVQLKRDGKR